MTDERETLNPYDIPLDRIVWLKRASPWENPLKVDMGPSEYLMSKDGHPHRKIAELYAPDKCTFHCHVRNFHPMINLAKAIALKMVTA